MEEILSLELISVNFLVSLISILKILALVLLVQRFFKTSLGSKISNILPVPFWIYFLPILLSTLGFLPHESPAYEAVSTHVFPAALILMLIGTPVTALIKLGPKASVALALGFGTMFVATLVTFVALVRFLPAESFKSAGALLATWTGGSANMVAIKELVSLSDASFAPLVIVDTLLSYGWMALLILGVSYQKWFDGTVIPAKAGIQSGNNSLSNVSKAWIPAFAGMTGALIFAFGLAELMIILGRMTGAHLPLISGKGWAILFASTAAVFLAMTPLHKMEQWGSSKIGTFLLYLVLATIGAKTDLSAATEAPIFILFGAGVLFIHGGLMLVLGRLFKIPLFLLSTSSQASVGGAISGPIVAEVYRPGTAQIGVIMGVIGNVVGTYVGLFGCWVCSLLEKSLR